MVSIPVDELIRSNWKNIDKIANFANIAKIARSSASECHKKQRLKCCDKIGEISPNLFFFLKIVNRGALSPNLPFLSSRAFLDISGAVEWKRTYRFDSKYAINQAKELTLVSRLQLGLRVLSLALI